MLTPEQVAFYRENGFLHVPKVFDAEQVAALAGDLDWMIQKWAHKTPGWSGPWRKAYMDDDTEAKSKLVAMHDLHMYADSWLKCVTDAKLVAALVDLLGPDVELHHSTMHVKPPETGHPFPMHQDMAFYEHADDRFIDVLVHLDDTRHANGEIRFLAGSHKGGYLEHVTEFEGEKCTPHLPTDQYDLADTVAVPAKAGDVVVFNVNTIHGSHINRTDAMRRMVRLGYRHPHNRQAKGQAVGWRGLMVAGRRHRRDGDELAGTPSIGGTIEAYRKDPSVT